MVEDVSRRILHEDNHLIILNKLCGELVQGDRTGDLPLLEKLREYIRVRDNKPGNVYLGLVHRLDRPTSGVVVFAKTSKALPRMNKLFQKNQLQKTYWALVDNTPPTETGSLRHYLKKNNEKNRSHAFDAPGSGRKEAKLDYRLLYSMDNYHLLELVIHSGRHHQIRAQLATVGVHIRGDLKYGAKRSNPSGGISLHARTLSFVHPVSDASLSITADPRDVQDDQLWNKLEIYNTM